jgi:hypothetical protein
MGAKRIVVVIAVMSLLMIGTVSPTPARADAAEIAIIAIAATVAYVAIIVGGTVLVNRSKSPWAEAPVNLEVDGKRPPPALRFGPKCRQSSAELTLVCW